MNLGVMDFYHNIDAPLKFDQTQTKHANEQNKISKWTNFQSHLAKYREAPSFWKFQFL